MSSAVLKTCLAVAVLVGCPATPAIAARCTPALAISRVQVIETTRATLIRVEGSLLTRDLVQLAYPLYLLFAERRSSESAAPYLIIDVAGGAVTGTAFRLKEGVDAERARELTWGGTPSPSAEVVFLGPDRIDVRIPAGALTGPIVVQAFVIDGTATFLSNVISLEFSHDGEEH